MLRHRDKRLNKLTKERYHNFLSTHIQNIDLPSSEEELNDPETADEVYASASDWLLQATRDRESAKLIFEENMNYGFRRNFWALRPMALLVDLVLAAVVIVLTVPLQSFPFSIIELNTATLVALAVIVVHILVVLGATKKWVLAAAEAYARQLLSACDVLNDKSIKG